MHLPPILVWKVMKDVVKHAGPPESWLVFRIVVFGVPCAFFMVVWLLSKFSELAQP
jgi:hypothetical protein